MSLEINEGKKKKEGTISKLADLFVPFTFPTRSYDIARGLNFFVSTIRHFHIVTSSKERNSPAGCSSSIVCCCNGSASSIY